MGDKDVMERLQITDWKPIKELIHTQWGVIYCYKYCDRLLKDLGKGNDRTFTIRYDWMPVGIGSSRSVKRCCAIYETTDMTAEEWAAYIDTGNMENDNV